MGILWSNHGAEEDVIPLPGAAEIEVRVQRSSRAKRLSLRVSHIDGKVKLTLPRRASLKQARRFLAEKADWVRRTLADQPAVCFVSVGQSIPIENRMVDICASADRKTVLQANTLLVPEDEKTAARVAAFLKTLARDRLAQASDHYARAIGQNFGRLTLRDTRSRWGSCTSQGNLMYSWRLIMAPPEVLQYVAAHEVAHLVEMNHSARFWALVAQMMPDYRTHRTWLRTNGARLHRYRFET